MIYPFSNVELPLSSLWLGLSSLLLSVFHHLKLIVVRNFHVPSLREIFWNETVHNPLFRVTANQMENWL